MLSDKLQSIGMYAFWNDPALKNVYIPDKVISIGENGFLGCLNTATFYKIPKNEMPKTMVVISDMEIDKYMRPGRHWDFLDVMRKRFADKGYKLPKIVMWNVNARKDTVLSQSEGVIFISGQSPSSFKALCQELDGITAYELMLQVLNGKAYAKVRI